MVMVHQRNGKAKCITLAASLNDWKLKTENWSLKTGDSTLPWQFSKLSTLLGCRLFWLHFCVAFGFGLHLTKAASSTARAC